MKFFSKSEAISIVVIFLILIAVSLPNFMLSIRRARDQVRRDDMGNIQTALETYYTDNGSFPLSSPDGRIIICKGPDGSLVACDWGQKWVSPVLGADKVYVDKTYMNDIPGDPHLSLGTTYLYFSDGQRYQIFGALEGKDEAGYDTRLVARGIKCGNEICNMGRSNNVPLYMTIEEYNLQIYCELHPKDAKCIK